MLSDSSVGLKDSRYGTRERSQPDLYKVAEHYPARRQMGQSFWHGWAGISAHCEVCDGYHYRLQGFMME